MLNSEQQKQKKGGELHSASTKHEALPVLAKI
jgi:hypothetical protein